MDKNSKVFFIGVSIIIGSLITITLLPNNTPSGFLHSIEWNVTEGDTFYYSLYDNYQKYDKDDNTNTSNILNSETMLKSEIVDVGDISYDLDQKDDLMILSSLVMLDETYGLQIPLSIDVYDIYTVYSFITSILGAQLEERLVPLNFPSAIHYLSSDVFTTLTEIMQNFPDFESIQLELENTVVDDVSELLSLASMFTDIEIAHYDFNDAELGTIPTDWEWTSHDKINNSIEVIDHVEVNPLSYLDYSVELTQNGNQSDDNILHWNNEEIFKTNFGYSDDELESDGGYPYNVLINTSQLSWYYQFDDSDIQHATIFNYSFPYDHSQLVGAIMTPFKGYNAMMFKIQNKELSAFVGNYIYGDDGFYHTTPLTGNWLPFGNISDEFDENIPLKFTVAMGEDRYNLMISDLSSGFNETFSAINYTMNFIVPSSDLLEGHTFRPTNFYDFKIIQNSSSSILEYFDNFDFNYGKLEIYTDGTQLAFRDPIYRDLIFALSLYHLLLTPQDFDYDVIANLLQIINVIWGTLARNDPNLPNILFKINNTETNLIITLEPDSVDALIKTALNIVIANTDPRYVLGACNTTITIDFDKINHILDSFIIFIDYLEMNIYRTIGMQLIATSNPNDNYPTHPESVFNTLLNNKLTEAETYFTSQITSIITWTIIGSVAGGSILGWGFSELARFIRKRKNIK